MATAKKKIIEEMVGEALEEAKVAEQETAAPIEEPKEEDSALERKYKELNFSGERVHYRVEKQKKHTAPYVYCSINGVEFLFAKGRTYEMPVEIVAVLDKAAESEF